MRIRVRLFARQRELAGTREIVLDLPAGATIADAWTALAAQVPAVASGRPFVRFARNGDYAAATSPLEDGDEIACIPPISGGAGEQAAGDDPVIRRLELRADPFPASLARELADAVATPADGAVVIFEGRTRSTPGTPAPGEEAEAARHAGRHRRVARVRSPGAAGPRARGNRSRTRWPAASGSGGWRSCTGQGTCPSAKRASSSWPRRPTERRPSPPPATR